MQYRLKVTSKWSEEATKKGLHPVEAFQWTEEHAVATKPLRDINYPDWFTQAARDGKIGINQSGVYWEDDGRPYYVSVGEYWVRTGDGQVVTLSERVFNLWYEKID
jgi:hypothetical protein